SSPTAAASSISHVLFVLLALLLGALAAADCLGRATPCASVRLGSLAPDRHAPAVTQPSIAPDIHQALDIHVHFATEITLDDHLSFDDLAKAGDLGIGEIAYWCRCFDASFIEDLLCGAPAD